MRMGMVVAILLAALAPSWAAAHSSIVPDQYATIQAAINASSDGDTVYVRDGEYPEALALNRPCSLIALNTVIGYNPRMAMPRVRSLTWTSSPSPRLVRGFRFTGSVSIGGSGDMELESCWCGGGLSCPALGSGHAWNNIVFGDAFFGIGGTLDLAMNTVIGGTMSYNSVGDAYIHDNAVIGPAAVGIRAWSDVYALRNYVRGCDEGIHTGVEISGALSNVVEDCATVGIITERNGSSNAISNNIVRRCGRGLDLSFAGAQPAGTTSGNVVEDSRAEGILARGGSSGTLENNVVLRSGGRGIDVATSFPVVRNNKVAGSGGDGLVVGATIYSGVSVSSNTVGHSVGRGIVGTGPGTYHGNTSYLNTGAGFDLTGSTGDQVDHNIGYRNSVGLVWSGSAPLMGCNDWYGNTGGTTLGVSPSPSDVALDPLFCHAGSDDVTLVLGSPLASLAGCGQVGALGVGCSTAGAPDPVPGTREFGLDAMPVPARGEVRFAWSAPGGGEIAVYDVTGQRRWSSALDGARGETVWRGVGSNGTHLAPGIYFARLTAGGKSTTKRVVLVP